MQKLIGEENEPIKPLLTTIRSLWETKRVSSILVVGGLGDFLDVADHVIGMKNYIPYNLTTSAKQLIKSHAFNSLQKPLIWKETSPRYLEIINFNPTYTNDRLRKKIPVRIKKDRLGVRKFEYGQDLLDLTALEQLIDSGQVLTLGFILLAMRNVLQSKNKSISVDNIVNTIMTKITNEGLDFLPTENKVRHGFLFRNSSTGYLLLPSIT